jgi:hypothetical protein
MYRSWGWGGYPRGYLGAGIGYPYQGFAGYPYLGGWGYPGIGGWGYGYGGFGGYPYPYAPF